MPNIIAVSTACNEPSWGRALQFGLDAPPNINKDKKSIDYTLICDDGAIIAIERKTPDDLLGTLAEGRLDDELQRLIKLTQESYLVITGVLRFNKNRKVITDGRGVTKWEYYKVMAKLRSIQRDGIIVSFCEHDSYFEEHVIGICKTDRSKPKVLMPKRDMIRVGDLERIFLAFPGMGHETFQRLGMYCGGEPFMMWLAMFEDETTEVKGISERMIGEWRSIFGLWCDMYFAINDRSKENE